MKLFGRPLLEGQGFFTQPHFIPRGSKSWRECFSKKRHPCKLLVVGLHGCELSVLKQWTLIGRHIYESEGFASSAKKLTVLLL